MLGRCLRFGKSAGGLGIAKVRDCSRRLIRNEKETMPKVAVITGAGSGVGRATAIKLVQQCWEVVLIGRTEETLRGTAGLTGKTDACVVAPLRIGDLDQTHKVGQSVLSRFGRV